MQKYTTILELSMKSEVKERRYEFLKETSNSPFITLQMRLLRIGKQVNCWLFWYFYLFIFRYIASIHLFPWVDQFGYSYSYFSIIYLHFYVLKKNLSTHRSGDINL